MNMSPNARHRQLFPPEPQRPIRYRTHRTVLERMRPLLITAILVFVAVLLGVGVVGLIARVHATEAQLQAAYLDGMAVGQRVCGSR